MARFLFLIASVLMIAAMALTLQSCGSDSVEAAAPTGPANSLITLPDGSTMTAARGSTARAIAEWLAARDGASAEFQFTGFREDTPALTTPGIGLAADLATMLRASPAATIELAGDEAQATALARLLQDRGISTDRMTIVPAAGLGAIALTVKRGSTEPLLTARK
jgi:hypothetical protein